MSNTHGTNGLETKVSLSYRPKFDEAIAEIATDLRGYKPDLAILFISALHSPCYFRVPETIRSEIGIKTLIGVSGRYVTANADELEKVPAIALIAIKGDDIGVTPFEIHQSNIPSADAPPQKWWDIVGVTPKDASSMILFADPVNVDTQQVLTGLDFAYPEINKVGALATGMSSEEDGALFLNNEVVRSRQPGIVGVSISGLELVSLVSNSSSAIGVPLVVSDVRENAILLLDGKPPQEILWGIYEGVSPDLQRLMDNGLLLGISTNDNLVEYARGDFVMRNLNYIDTDSGAMVVGERVSEGQIVQFHVVDPEFARDSLTATEDAIKKGVSADTSYVGSLTFSCVSRGSRLFDAVGYEAQALKRALGDIPMTGVSCNGQIVTLNGASQLLGYTTSSTFLRAVPQKADNRNSTTKQQKRSSNLQS